MTKLSILIPQYNENEEVIKPLLDSIQMQQNINLKEDIKVYIGNDGSDTKLSLDFLKQYSFRMQYHLFKHERLAATRQKLFELTDSEYVMFCDADDKFINTLALSIIINNFKEQADIYVYDFIAEYIKDNITLYKLYHDDSIFVHGKVYRSQYLIDNDIIWHKELHEHQDSAYNVLARLCSDKVAICPVAIYAWVHNPNSISRKDGKLHSLITWPHMIDSYDCLVKDLQDRAKSKQAGYYAKYCLYATYFEMARQAWCSQQGQKYKQATYQRVYDFYMKYRLLIKTVDEEYTQKLIKTTQELTLKKEKIETKISFTQWLNSIIMLYQN